jgi:uncharacterized protein (TIGR02453 family)
MKFRGWPVEALEFYEELEADNSRAFWQANRTRYDELVHAPMAALLAELAPEFGEGRIFRPNRDVRFSHDKSPYKTNIAARLERGGYISLSADGLGAGLGYYMMATDQLDRYRKAVAADKTGGQLQKLVDTTRKKDIQVTAHESLKTAPRGYAKDHPRIELLRQKGLISWKEWPVAAWLGTAQAKKRIVDFLHAAQPLVTWLDANVGPTALVEDR